MGETVFVGQADATNVIPAVTRRDFLKLASLGTTSIAFLLSGCEPASDTILTVKDYLAWQDSLPENQRAENLIAEWLKRGIGNAYFDPLADMVGTQTADTATTQVYMETPENLVLMTDEHVGRYLWKGLHVKFPFGQSNRNLVIDARIAAEGGPKPTDEDWWIQNVTAHSDPDKGIFHPIRTIFIKKPKDFSGYIVGNDYEVLRAPSKEPQPGEKFIVGGFTGESPRLVASVLEYQRTTDKGEVRDAVIPLYQFKGFARYGMSGSVIINGQGKIAALLQGGFTKNNIVYGIPYASYQPISEVNSVLTAGR